MTMPSLTANPFRQFRAEQFDENLWSYYVPEPFDNLLGSKPLVLEGGRGSGKTMFFLCSSWREQRYAIQSRGDSLADLLTPDRHVGLYYRVDTPFVTSLCGGDLPPSVWAGVFATYLSACLLRELVEFLLEGERVGVVSEPQLNTVFERVGQILVPTERLSGLSALRNLLGRTLDHVERVANNPTSVAWSSGTIPGRLLSESIAALREVSLFEGARFHIFIDEYESLLDYQQRQVNSLIKHSSAKLVYNIGLRPNGMRTAFTTSDTEQIQEPHDYKRFRPEHELSSEGSDGKRLEKVLREICRKRLENAHILNANGDTKWHDIGEYLGSYSVEDELASFASHEKKTLDALSKLIQQFATEPATEDEYFNLLGRDAPVANARLHLCLLQRAPQFRPTVEELASEYQAWRDGKTSRRYTDWWNNTKLGVVFLLAHEHRRPKRYSGIDVFAMLSSGIIRYFIELCEQAFDFAQLNGFTWTAPRALTHEEQTKAARYVSKYKVNDIERYPMGAKLRQLTMSLGTVFQALHTGRNTTLGEPEVNHFSVAADQLAADSSGVRELLAEAVLWAILQNRPSTKDKEVERKADTLDYHLNHIYCPYFGISYRQKRKVELSVAQLASLSGSEEVALRSTIRGVLKEERAPGSAADAEDTIQLNLLERR